MAQIKAAFFDIDGTLLPFHAKALPKSTVQALAALRKNGVKTFIATGRPPVHLPYLHALDGIPFDGYVTMLEYAGSASPWATPAMPPRPPRIMSPTTLPQTALQRHWRILG